MLPLYQMNNNNQIVANWKVEKKGLGGGEASQFQAFYFFIAFVYVLMWISVINLIETQ